VTPSLAAYRHGQHMLGEELVGVLICWGAQARQPKEAGPWIGAAASKGKRAGGTWWSGPGLGGWPSGGMDGVEQWLARREQGPVSIGVAARCTVPIGQNDRRG
jgi:hypothetical protein